MSTTLPNHPRVSAGGSRIARSDLLIMERARALIDDLGADLDRRLLTERRPAERLRLLRETTNQITRTANDAVQAYVRGRRSVDARLERDADAPEAATMRDRLREARVELLEALERAKRRY